MLRLSIISFIVYISFAYKSIAQNNNLPCPSYQDVVDNYSQSLPNYHEYTVANYEICDLNQFPCCTPEFVFNIMISQGSFVAPYAGSQPIVDCGEVHVFGFGHIVTKINSTALSVTNYTRSDHILYSGKVVRTVVALNNKIYVYTTGVGNNSSQWLAWLNQNQTNADLVWNHVSENLKTEVINQLTIKKNKGECEKVQDISLFLFDISGSMNENNKIGQARQAAKSTINTIKQEAQLNNSKPEIGLMVFSGMCVPNPTTLVLPFTDDLNKALSGVDKIPNPIGGTPLPQALDNAKTSLETELKNKGQSCASLVILSDGQSTCGEIRPPSAYAGVQTSNICGSSSTGALRIKYFTVGLNILPGSVAERDLQFLAASTGGKYFQAKDEKELTRAFQKISRKYIPLPSTQMQGVDASFLSLFSSAVGYITNQQYDTALVMFKRYTANYPSDPAGIYNLALANEANERYKSAAKFYEQYLQLIPTASNAQVLRDRIQNLRKDYDEFVSYMKQYLQTDTAFFKQYYAKLQTNPNTVSLTGEFAGFINEKATYYKNLPDVIESEDPQVKQYSKEVSQAFKDATHSLKTAKTWLDILPAIGNIYEPLDRLMKRVAR